MSAIQYMMYFVVKRIDISGHRNLLRLREAIRAGLPVHGQPGRLLEAAAHGPAGRADAGRGRSHDKGTRFNGKEQLVKKTFQVSSDSSSHLV